MVKTTPPGRGSRLLRVVEDNPIWRRCVRTVDGVRLAATGGFAESDLGVACYHSKVGAVELILNHLVDADDEYVVVDMTAGADAFASGLFTRFDRTFVVCEPTVRAVGVYRQYLDYAADYQVAVSVVGNKVADEADEAFLRAARRRGPPRMCRGVPACAGRRTGPRRADRRAGTGEPRGAGHHARPLWTQQHGTGPGSPARLCSSTCATPRHGPTTATGEDLAGQIDPGFTLGPEALSVPAS